MFCRNCGQNLPEGTMFCEKCGTKIADVTEDVSVQQPEEDVAAQPEEQAVEQPVAEPEQPAKAPKKAGKKKAHRVKGKVIAILTVAVVAVVGVGTFAYNSQPFLSRLFKGEKEHIIQVIDNFGKKYESSQVDPFKDINAKITTTSKYDMSSLANDLGNILGNSSQSDGMSDMLENLKAEITQVSEIDGKNGQYRLTWDGNVAGAEFPQMSIAASSEDMGLFIDGLTEEYISLPALIDMAYSLLYKGNEIEAYASEEIPGLDALAGILEKSDELTALLEKYKDTATEILFDEENIKYESNNEKLGFSSHYYEISVSGETLIDIVKAILEQAKDDDQLIDLIYDIMSEFGEEIGALPSKNEFKQQIEQLVDEALNGMETEMDEELAQMMKTELFCIEIWFDGQNNPLGIAFSIKYEGQKMSLTMLDYKQGNKSTVSVSLKASGRKVFEIRNEYTQSGSNLKGEFSIDAMSMLDMKADYNVTTFKKHTVELWEGEMNFSLSITGSDIDMGMSMSEIKAEAKIKSEKLSDGTKMTCIPSVKMSGMSMDLGKLTVSTKVEALDKNFDINTDEFVTLTEENISQYINIDGFEDIMEDMLGSLGMAGGAEGPNLEELIPPGGSYDSEDYYGESATPDVEDFFGDVDFGDVDFGDEEDFFGGIATPAVTAIVPEDFFGSDFNEF